MYQITEPRVVSTAAFLSTNHENSPYSEIRACTEEDPVHVAARCAVQISLYVLAVPGDNGRATQSEKPN